MTKQEINKVNAMKEDLKFYLAQLDRIEEDAMSLNKSIDEVLEHIKKNLIGELSK